MVVVWAIVYIAFIYGLYFLTFGSSSNFDLEHYNQANSFLYSTLFWALLNPGPVDFPEFLSQSSNVTGRVEGAGNETGEGSGMEDMMVSDSFRLRIWISKFALALYQIITVILLLNLVIAAMNTTITKLEMSKEKIWKYYRVVIQGHIKFYLKIKIDRFGTLCAARVKKFDFPERVSDVGYHNGIE